MAWIEEHGGGYRVAWRGANGKREHGETQPNKAKALADQRNIEAQLKARKALTGMRVLPLDELVERYLESVRERGRCNHDYAADVRACLLGTKPDPPRKPRAGLFEDRGWQSVKDITPASVGVLTISQHRFLKAVLRHAQLLDQPVDARCARLRAPQTKRAPKAALLTEPQVLRALARAARFNRDLVLAGHLVATYGHRPESLAKARVKDVELTEDGGWLTLTVKSGDLIRHPLHPWTASIIRRVIEGRRPTDPLLVRPDGAGGWASGNALSIYWYHQVGEWATPKAPGIYQLKRAALSAMLRTGLDVATIASMTGHRTPAVILTYARTNEQQQREALAAMARGRRSELMTKRVPPKSHPS